jgi:alanine-synthesizing transaminase
MAHMGIPAGSAAKPEARRQAMIVSMFSSRTQWKLDPNRFTLAHQAAMSQGRELIDLTLSNPTQAGIEYDSAAILAALQDSEALNYDPQPKGLLRARAAVAEYYLKSNISGMPNPTALAKGGLVDPDDIILATSTSEGYSFILRLLCNPGDEILVPKPSYPLFDFLAELNDVKLTGYPLIYDHGWQIDFRSLESTVTERTRAIIVVHPNNPTGSYVTSTELDYLNRICSRHDLALIADEVFLDYELPKPSPDRTAPHPSSSGEDRGVHLPNVLHNEVQHQSFVCNGYALTFTLSGLSKIAALPQMKLAWIVVSGPDPQKQAALERLEIVADTYLSLNAPVQLAAKALLNQRHSIQPQLMSRIGANLSLLDHQLASQRFCARLISEGGWYAVLRVPATQSDEDLAVGLLENHSVLVHPGHFYDFPSEGFLVLSLISQPDQFRAGISRLLEFIDRTHGG